MGFKWLRFKFLLLLLLLLLQSDTVFWDKMQAEWEELARRNWLEDSESDAALPPAVSPNDKVRLTTCMHARTHQTLVGVIYATTWRRTFVSVL